jgi:catechol 2,3-dioxygenase-like lactoylglutathione lyase family enzyme
VHASDDSARFDVCPQIDEHEEVQMRMTLAVALAAVVGSAAGGVVGQARDVVKPPRLFRVILPVADVAKAEAFYTKLLGVTGRRVAPQRHYFDAGEVILALVDPRGEEGVTEVRPNQEYVYFAVSDLERLHARAAELGALDPEMGSIARRPWGERSFYAHDASGNPICFVDETTLFTGR